MYIDPSKKPYPFCPGCSHGLVLDAIDRALTKINADPKKTVLVSDIGCVGLADNYFNIHTFHGLHGRSFTYACGIKLANPELNVFVLVGDGGCGIGGHHLINAARRNIGIKVIIFNNFNFGMTGGQHSVTTPFGGRTNTTPTGNQERAFDLATLCVAAGAPFVARKLAFDKDLDETIAQAFQLDGFAVLDIWETCTAYFSPLNDFKKSSMEALAKEKGIRLGVLKEEKVSANPPSPPFPPEADPPSAETKGGKGGISTTPKGVERRFDHALKQDSFSVVIAGSAGMKIISSAGHLGVAALKSGLWASQKDDFPITVQTGHSISELKFSPIEIEYLGVDEPDVIIVLSKDGLMKATKRIEALKKSALVIAAKGLELKTQADVVTIDPAGIDKKVLATAAIATLIRKTGFITMDAFKDALSEISNEVVRKGNLEVITKK